MIEKGKGLVLGKLRTIQLMQVYFQLLMRIFVNTRNKGSIEVDERISKNNYGSRLGYSIQDAILEKRQVFDYSLVTRVHYIYALIYLQLAHDRQLSKMGSMLKESVGVESKPIMLITKVMPIMENYVCTAFGVSKECYGGRKMILAGTGQGNVVSGNTCRDSSCLT